MCCRVIQSSYTADREHIGAPLKRVARGGSRAETGPRRSGEEPPRARSLVHQPRVVAVDRGREFVDP